MKEAGKRLAERIRREEKEKREAVSHDPAEYCCQNREYGSRICQIQPL